MSGDIWAASARRHRLPCAATSGVWQAALAGLWIPAEPRVWALGLLRALASFDAGPGVRGGRRLPVALRWGVRRAGIVGPGAVLILRAEYMGGSRSFARIRKVQPAVFLSRPSCGLGGRKGLEAARRARAHG